MAANAALVVAEGRDRLDSADQAPVLAAARPASPRRRARTGQARAPALPPPGRCGRDVALSSLRPSCRPSRAPVTSAPLSPALRGRGAGANNESARAPAPMMIGAFQRNVRITNSSPTRRGTQRNPRAHYQRNPWCPIRVSKRLSCAPACATVLSGKDFRTLTFLHRRGYSHTYIGQS